jgi:hypothetical protein
MTTQSATGGSSAHVVTAPNVGLLVPREAARLLKVSLSWMAKARMRGDGPPYSRIGRSIRYSEAVLIQWAKSQQRISTSDLSEPPRSTSARQRGMRIRRHQHNLRHQE